MPALPNGIGMPFLHKVCRKVETAARLALSRHGVRFEQVCQPRNFSWLAFLFVVKQEVNREDLHETYRPTDQQLRCRDQEDQRLILNRNIGWNSDLWTGGPFEEWNSRRSNRRSAMSCAGSRSGLRPGRSSKCCPGAINSRADRRCRCRRPTLTNTSSPRMSIRSSPCSRRPIRARPGIYSIAIWSRRNRPRFRR